MTRVGASQVFFNVVAGFNARKLIQDVDTAMNVMKAVTLDSFEAMLKPIEDMSMAMGVWTGEVIQIQQELERAQIELKKFYSGTADVVELGEEIEGIAQAYGVLGDEARIAGARAAQVGAIIGNDNIPLLVEQAEILHQISDLTSEEAMKSIISLNQQTGMLYGELNQQQYQRLDALSQEAVLTKGLGDSLNTLNSIANHSVAVEGQLVEVMTQFASQGALVGDSFEGMAAMSAVLLESGEQAGAAGRALRMVYARLGGDIGGARSELESLGFNLTDENGNLNTMTEVIQELTDKGWKNFTQATKQHIAQTVAGNRHYVRFIKLMENQERVVDLSTIALEDNETAAGQAADAMEQLTNQLDIARAHAENLKAEAGEAMMPFVIGQQKAKNQFAEARNEMLGLMDNLGPISEIMGKLVGTFQVFGGMIKMSLGIQSLGIGMGMFQSVQEDLHGILIANETLHSKQPTYFEMNHTAGKRQAVILKGIQFGHQVINRHLETQNHMKHIMAALDMKAAPLVERRLDAEKQMGDSQERRAEAQKKAQNMATMRVALADKRVNSLGRIRNIMVANEATQEHELSLLQRWNAVYKEKTTAQEYYQRQLIIDSDTMALLKRSEVEQIEKANDKLHGQSMIFQRIISENERLRTLQKAGASVSGATSNDAMVSDARRAIPILEEFEEKQTNIFKAYGKRLQLGQQLSESEQDDLKLTGQRITGAKNLRSSLDGLIDGSQKHINLNKHGVLVARDINKALLAQNIQFDNTLAKRRALADVEQQYVVYQKASLAATQENAVSTKELRNILKELGPINEELEARIRDVEVAMEAGADAADEQRDMIAALNDVTAISQTKFETLQKSMEKDYTKAVTKAKDATKRFGFAASSSIGMVLPLMNDTKYAAMGSALMFTTQLTPAIAGTTKAFTAMIDSQIQLAAAQGLGNITRTKAIGNILMQNKAMIGLGVAMMGVMYALGEVDRAQKAANESMKEAAGITKEAIGALIQITDTTLVLGEGGEFLRDKFELQGVTLKSLADDSEATANALETLTNHNYELSKAQQEQIDQSLEQLRIIKMIQDGTNDVSDAMKNARQEVQDTYEGALGEGKNTWDEVTAELAGGFGMSDREEASLDLKDALGLSDDAIDETWLGSYHLDIEEVLDEVLDIMEDGTRLTKNQMKLLGEVLNNDTVLNSIKEFNDVIVNEGTMEEIEYSLFGDRGSENAMENIDLIGKSVENLTEDIYKFGGAREELFFGGKYGNVTGSLYKQVITQGVGTLYNKMDIVMSNNFHGFFNEEAAAHKIINVLERYAANGGEVAID